MINTLQSINTFPHLFKASLVKSHVHTKFPMYMEHFKSKFTTSFVSLKNIFTCGTYWTGSSKGEMVTMTQGIGVVLTLAGTESHLEVIASRQLHMHWDATRAELTKMRNFHKEESLLTLFIFTNYLTSFFLNNLDWHRNNRCNLSPNILSNIDTVSVWV